MIGPWHPATYDKYAYLAAETGCLASPALAASRDGSL